MERANGAPDNGIDGPRGTIAFATVGRSQYAFDVYEVSLPENLTQGGGSNAGKLTEKRLTDGISVNSNGHLVEGKGKEDALLWIIKGGANAGDKEAHLDLNDVKADELNLLVYVTEREGCLRIAASISSNDKNGAESTEALFDSLWVGHAKEKSQQKTRNILTVKQLFHDNPWSPHLEDRPQVGGGRIVFVSTEQTRGLEEHPRQSWTAVYSSSLGSSEVVRLTPDGVADYSPSLSPSGKWVAAASLEGKGWHGALQNLPTDLYVFSAADGSERRTVVENAGWPSWSDESTIYFHRKAEDGWWSVFRISLPEDFLSHGKGVIDPPCRVTPPGLHAFTPSASQSGNWIAVATRRPGSSIRHLEIFDLSTHSFIELTKSISPDSHHFNPHVSPSTGKIVYHRRRGGNSVPGEVAIIPRLEPLRSPLPGLSLIRIDGSFPAFSPDGSLMAYTSMNFDGVIVTRSNGEGKRQIFSGPAFGLAWDRKREGVVYIGSGPQFAPENDTVHIISVFGATLESLSGNQSSSVKSPEYKILTKNGTGNNAFPSPSPDGKHLVFRSGRNGHKNLYIMDAIDGEEKGIRQLTDGPWTDTMPNWSPDGQWIGFSSNRHECGDTFSGYVIHPDGSGLKKIVATGGGRVNHFAFSPDSQLLVFTADFAAVSAEPISTPNQFQPYGDMFLCNVDGSDVRRLTHNAYEDGTPCWTHTFIDPSDLSSERGEPARNGFKDQLWLAKGGRALEEGENIKWCS